MGAMQMPAPMTLDALDKKHLPSRAQSTLHEFIGTTS